MCQLLPLFVSVFVFLFVFVFVAVIEFLSEFGKLTSLAFRKCMVWGVPEARRQCFSSSMNSGKNGAGGRTDGQTDEGSIRGPRGPQNLQCEFILHSSTKSCFDVHIYVQLTKLRRSNYRCPWGERFGRSINVQSIRVKCTSHTVTWP